MPPVYNVEYRVDIQTVVTFFKCLREVSLFCGGGGGKGK